MAATREEAAPDESRKRGKITDVSIESNPLGHVTSEDTGGQS